MDLNEKSFGRFSGNDDLSGLGETDYDLVVSPRSGVTLLSLGDYEGQYHRARERTAKKIDCEYVKAWFREGTALTELGDYEGAALCFFEGMQVEGQSENPDLKRGFDAAIKKGRDAMGKK